MSMDAVIGGALETARLITKRRVEAEMVSLVQITRGMAASLGPDGELVPDPAVALVYSGICHLGTAAGPVTYTIGDEVQFFSSGTATIPLEWDPLGDGTLVTTLPQVDDLLQVTAHDDYGYVGREFRVVDVENLGTLAAYRRLQIVGIARSPGWIDAAVRHPSAGPVPDQIPPEWKL
jgi:hypothetical protein